MTQQFKIRITLQIIPACIAWKLTSRKNKNRNAVYSRLNYNTEKDNNHR